MPDWVWGLIIVVVVLERMGKLKVFDFARGLVHVEFDNQKPDKCAKPTSRKKSLEK